MRQPKPAPTIHRAHSAASSESTSAAADTSRKRSPGRRAPRYSIARSATTSTAGRDFSRPSSGAPESPIWSGWALTRPSPSLPGDDMHPRLLGFLAFVATVASASAVGQQYVALPPGYRVADVTPDGEVVVGEFGSNGFIWRWREEPA